jgi:hypothetical protein
MMDLGHWTDNPKLVEMAAKTTPEEAAAFKAKTAKLVQELCDNINSHKPQAEK